MTQEMAKQVQRADLLGSKIKEQPGETGGERGKALGGKKGVWRREMAISDRITILENNWKSCNYANGTRRK